MDVRPPFWEPPFLSMKTFALILLIAGLFWAFSWQTCPAGEHSEKSNAFFLFSHTKAETCGENWLFMEKIIEKNGDRCREVINIQGFPYLRGSAPVLEMARNLGTRYACHEWLELLRRIDLQARYAELSMLPASEIEKFCSRAGIDCFQGRIRAYVAKCSAMIMGDEKRNHNYMETLKTQSLKSLENPRRGSRVCFRDGGSLDGLAGTDSLNMVLSPPKTGTRSTSYLEQRIQRSKQAPGR